MHSTLIRNTQGTNVVTGRRPKVAIDNSSQDLTFLRQRVIDLEKIVMQYQGVVGELVEQREGDSIVIEELLNANLRIETKLNELSGGHNEMALVVNAMDPPTRQSPKVRTTQVTTTNKHADDILSKIRQQIQPN